MAVKERSQIKGTDAQIKAFAGHNGVLAFATDTKSLHVLSGTAGTTTEFLPSTKLATVATSGSYNDLSDKPVVDSALSSTSENPVQNKVINSALDGKLSTSGGMMTGTLVVAQGDNSIDGGVADGSVQFNANGNLGGANLRLYGAQNTQFPGQFRIWAQTGDKSRGLFGDVNGDANGSLTWGGNPVLCGESGGFPVGFIALYAGSNVPNGWFRCDGSTIADMATNYPKLYAVLGTNVLPNYSGRTIYGASSDINQAVASGLPNITGGFIGNAGTTLAWLSIAPSGVFSALKGEGNISKGFFNPSYTYPIEDSWGARATFDASRSSAIYGRSTDVQPPAVKVAVLIRHD